MNVDLHSHFFPLDAFRQTRQYAADAPTITVKDGRCAVVSSAGSRGNLPEGAYRAEARIRDLDRMKIDLQAISPSPILLYYGAAPDSAVYFSRLQNEAIQAVVEAHPHRFIGLGTAPLQSSRQAVAVAEEAKRLGLRGLEVGTSVNGSFLDEPEFEPFLEAAQSLGLLLFVHPIENTSGDRSGGVLGNVVGFLYQTALVIERMILKGCFERYPNLRLCLAHGGGFLPANIWRLDHAYQQRAELRKIVPRLPSEYLRRFYFDSIVHSVIALKHLVEVVGTDRVVIGTDYPMLMGDMEPVPRIHALESLTDTERSQILGGNALRALAGASP